MKTIGFIGCGNMGRAMVEGIMKAKLVDGDHMIVSNTHPERLSELSKTYDCYISDNESVAKYSDIIVLAIKPHVYKEVITSIKDIVKEDVVIINIAAGIGILDIEEMFERKVKNVKAMPNTPAMVQEAMSAISFSDNCTQEDKEDVIAIFESFGKCREVEERLMDAVMVVAGSSPAYLFMVLEAMADGAVMQGLSRSDAYTFAAQAMIGSAKMLLETGKHPGELKDMVCSPAGTTIEAVAKMEEMGLRSAIIEGMRACANRGKEMSRK